MKIEKIYLLFTVINDDNTWPSDLSWDYKLSNKNTLTLAKTMYDGLAISSSRKIVLNPILITPVWIENVEKIVLYNYGKIRSKKYLTLLYILKPESLSILFPQGALKNNQTLDISKVVEQLFLESVPDLAELDKKIGKRVKTEGWLSSAPELTNYKCADLFSRISGVTHLNKKYSYLDPFLIIMPEKNELISYRKSESPSEFLNRFEQSTDRSQYLPNNIFSPYWYYNFIETIQSYHSLLGNKQFRMFIRTTPLRRDDRIDMPESIEEFYRYELAILELAELNNDINKLYSNQYSLKNYIDHLYSKDIFKRYIEIFKNERLHFIEVKFEAESFIEHCKNSFDKKGPWELRNSYDKHEFAVTNSEADKFVYSILRGRNNEFQGLLNSTDRLMKVNVQKDEYLNEYIRDSIAVESTWTNLKLQKAVKKLTWIAIIIGLVAIIASLYGNEIKVLIKDIFER